MSVAITIFPNPVVHSAAYEVFITGLVPGHTHAIYTNNVTTASSAATGTADANGTLAKTITAAAPTGLWFLHVIDTNAGTVLVGQTSFTQS